MSRADGGAIAALFRDYRTFAGARLWLGLALMLLGAFAEGFGILILVPLAALAIGRADDAQSRLTHFLDRVPTNGRLALVLVLFVGAMGARSLLLYLRERELARLQSGYETSLRLRSARTLASRGWGFAAQVGQAGMQALLLTDVPRAALAVAQAQLFATAFIMLAVQLLIAFVLSPALAAIASAVLFAGFLLSIRWTRRSMQSGIALTDRSEESTGSGFRLHSGLKAALAQGTVSQFLREYRSTLAAQQSEAVRFAGDLASARQLAAFGAAIAAALLLFVGLRVLALPFAVLVPALVLFARMVGPAQMLQHSAQYVGAYSAGFAAIGRRLGSLDERPEQAAHAEPLEWSELRLDQAAFRHGSGFVLPGMSLTLGAAQWVGIKGPSGAGKTTLVDLVAGLLSPSSGRMLIDGRELDGQTLERWRSSLAYVGQDGSVFDDSVRGNLLADGAEADEGRLWDVLSTAGLSERIRALPGGLDQRVGDHGSQLSGGERQRLVIARALLRRPALLIFDEATAALDPESEATLLGRIRELEPRPAAILVAHRDSTLAHCDSVVAIQHGSAQKSVDSSGLQG